MMATLSSGPVDLIQTEAGALHIQCGYFSQLKTVEFPVFQLQCELYLVLVLIVAVTQSIIPVRTFLVLINSSKLYVMDTVSYAKVRLLI